MSDHRIAYAIASMFLVLGCGDRAGGARIDGNANVFHGPSAGASFAVGPRPGAGLADGRWQVSPDQGKATLLVIDLIGAEAGTDTAFDLEDCEVTWERAADSLSPILTCPFTVEEGTYIGMSVGVSTTFQVLIDDSAHGLFTDAAAGSRLSTVAPAAGAEFVDFEVPGPGGEGDRLDFQTYFTSPLVIGPEDSASLAISLVVDMTHTMEVDVVAGQPAFRADFTPVPMFLFASVTDVGKATFYTDLATAENVLETPNFPPNTMRFFYNADNEPAFVWAGAATAGCQLGDRPSNAWNTSALTSPVHTDGTRPGGYLGLDPAGTLCWALPLDATWETYNTLFAMPEATALGASTTLSCQTTSNVPAPTSGDNYGSGCPPVTPTGTATLMLVAD